jgi:hypothetical protein
MFAPIQTLTALGNVSAMLATPFKTPAENYLHPKIINNETAYLYSIYHKHMEKQ